MFYLENAVYGIYGSYTESNKRIPIYYDQEEKTFKSAFKHVYTTQNIMKLT